MNENNELIASLKAAVSYLGSTLEKGEPILSRVSKIDVSSSRLCVEFRCVSALSGSSENEQSPEETIRAVFGSGVSVPRRAR